MGKTPIKPRSPWPKPYHAKWKACSDCFSRWVTCELKFNAGSTLPPVGETLTGGNSGHTGVVTEIETLLSGTWGGGDAAGYIHLDTLSGLDEEQYTIFEDEELITGSTGSLTADGDGQVKIWSVLYPKELMVKEDGRWYCVWHHGWRFRPKHRDEEKIKITETERGKE